MLIQFNGQLGAKLVLSFLAIFALVQAAVSQTTATDESTLESSVPQDEITVVGKKRLLTLRNELYSAQEKFFAKFNDLNSDRKFDFDCKVVTNLSDRRRRHVCMPRFAKRIEARMNQDMRHNGNWWGDATYAGPGRKDQRLLLREMETLLRENDDLRAAQQEVAEARQAYQAASDNP